MLFRPATMALLLATGVDLLLLAGAALFAVQVLRHWDLASGSARQIALERRTYLVATLVALVCVAELASLLLFVYNADHLAPQFVGAMCAVGTLNANAYGFPALGLKVLLFFLAAVWLTFDYLDNRAWDYPLIRVKYALLLLLLPVAGAAAAMQWLYFLNLRADVITSCCGSLFGADNQALGGDLAALPPGPAMVAFYLTLGATVATGLYHTRSGRALPLFALLGGLAFVVGLAAIVSFVSLYIYEHPHHHCPFCILKPEYHYQGYALYLPLFTATALALGLGAVRPFARAESIRPVLAAAARRGVLVATLLYALFGVLVTAVVLGSKLVLLGG